MLLVRGANALYDMIVTGLAERLPYAEIRVLEGADHLLLLRDPATLARLTVDFVARHSRAATV